MDRRRRRGGLLIISSAGLPCSFAYVFFSALMIFGVSGCSVAMEATRPTPTDLHQFSLGESRASIHQDLGAPSADTVEADGVDCEVYQLYTRGYGAGGKAGIAAAEGTADILTFGLAEIAMAPTEALTRNKKHPVSFCYSLDKLARVELGIVTASKSVPPHVARGRIVHHHRHGHEVFARSGRIWETADSQPKPLADSPFPPTYVVQQAWPAAGLPLPPTYVVPTSGATN